MTYNFNGLDLFLSRIEYEFAEFNGIDYYNFPCSFDIETTSFYHNGDKRAIMYHWQFAINESCIFGRNWKQFEFLLSRLTSLMKLNEKRRLIIFVHNLAFEFQFIYKMFKWSRVFATDERKPIQAVTGGFEFRCTLRMSGYSLDTLAKNLLKHKIHKLKGDLNYELLRNEHTPLTRKERLYCYYDCLIVNYYIDELKDKYKVIAKIPLTQTGFVREYVRNKCFENDGYKDLIKTLTLTDKEYLIMKNAYMGGFTHCNALYTNTIIEDVSSYDFTSSYPTVLLSEKYPMGKGKRYLVKSLEQVEKLSEKYCLLLSVNIINLRPSFKYENILSLSKCIKVVNPLVNNGRIVCADFVSVCLTELDLFNISRFYVYDTINFGECYIYEKNYLPLPIIESVLKFYNDKTILKGVKGKESEYMNGKEKLNSLYGMCVTSIVHNDISINNGKWETTINNLQDELTKYNFSKTRFLFYAWGVWVTAYARNNLFTAILECGRDYIYSDTDSVKIMDADKHCGYFQRYNADIVRKLENTLDYYKIDRQKIRPKNIYGKEKILGVWDYEGKYDRFKSLGAKRYITEKDGDIEVTACGLSKKLGRDYIADQKNPFEFFNDGMTIDKEHSGRMIHSYGDYEINGQLTDYLGNIAHYYERSFVHLEKSGYQLSLSSQYINYFRGLQYE